MFSIRLLSAFAAATTLFSMASAADSSSILLIPTPTATVAASAMETIGCFETGTPLDDHGKGYFTSPGSCQQICLGLKKDVLGLSDGDHCWCGDFFPPKDSMIGNNSCNTPCSGTKEEICGGKAKLWVMTTGNTLNEVDFYDPKSASSSSSTAAAATSATQAPESTQAAPTVVVTESSAPKKNSPNKAGIAAGVVVGVIALAAIIGGVFFWLRQKRRREVEEEYRRQAAVNSFVSGGKLHTSNSSMTDSRLDPDFMARRQSNGSIADNEDYSRRILKVTNA